MKRNLLAIAIPALLVAGAANASIEIWNKDGNKLSVNGRVYALNYLGDKNNERDGEGDKTTARLGFSGETQVTELLTGYGRAEWETNTGSDSFKETRYAFAGLGFGQYGSFDYGRNDGVLKTITSYTDVLPEFGGDASNNDYYTLSARTKAVATYRNDGFFGQVDGLRFAIQYADDGDNSVARDSSLPNGDEKSKEAYGAVIDYDVLDTGISVGAAYAQSTGKEKSKAWNTGIKYDAYNLYLAAQYIEGKHQKLYEDNNDKLKDVKVRGFEVVAQYGIDFEYGRLTPSVAYVQHKLKDTYDTGFKKDVANYVEVGLQYDFNKNLTALIDYKINLLDKKDIGAATYDKVSDSYKYGKANTKDTVALGLIYQF